MGGAQKHVLDLATRLPKDKYDVEVITGRAGQLTEALQKHGISSFGSLEIDRDVKIGSDIKALWKIVSLLRHKRPDVLHLHSSKVGALGAIAGRIAGIKKIIFTSHGWAFNEDRSFISRVFISLVYWVTMICSHETIVVSEFAKKQVEKWPFIKDTLTVVRNGISKESDYSKENARLELVRIKPEIKKTLDGVSEKNIYWIGSLAELHHIKGYPYAINAVANTIRALEVKGENKKVIYTICGDGEERQRIEKMISDMGLSDRVFLMGQIPGASQYIKAFDLFLMTSKSEGLPYAILEAGLAGTTILATSVGGIPEIIDDMHSGILVRPESQQELDHAMLYAIEHQKECKNYGLKLKDRIQNQFSIEKMLADIETVYNRKIEKKNTIKSE